MMTKYMSIVIGVIGGYFIGYAFGVGFKEGKGFFDSIRYTFIYFTSGHVLMPINISSILGFVFGSVIVGMIVHFLMDVDNQKHYHHDSDTVAGTGGFMEKKDMEAYAKQYIAQDPPPIKTGLPVAFDPEHDQEMYSQNIIMSQNFCRPINSRKLIGNTNVLVVGAAGTGKSRFVIKPNLLQMNSSYVITDPSGEMIYSVGGVLRDHGYKIKIFNISDMQHSNCYNPLAYIRDEAGVKMLIECLINNTTKGEGGGDNQFFVDAEQLLYSACIFYLIDFCHDESQKNFAGVMTLINKSSVNEMNPNEKSELDQIFDELPQSSLAWKYYKAFKQAAGKTLKSIIISCVTRLQPFLIPQVVNLTRVDTLELEKMGNEKTALFIITPQADRAYSFLASILYSQLFETLYHVGEQQKAEGKSEMLKIPVRCMMDEFANIGEVPAFPSRLATMRKYNISATVVLQNISQIEAMYEDDWKTLVGNCSTIIFLGSQEPEVLKYFSEMLGKMTIRVRSEGVTTGGKSGANQNYQSTAREVLTAEEMGRLPSQECIVFTQHMRPVRDKKYKYENHPYYDQTADKDDKLGFKYQDLSIYDNSRTGLVESIILAQKERARFHERTQKYAKQVDPSKVALDKNKHPVEAMSNQHLDEEQKARIVRAAIEEAVIRGSACKDDNLCIIVVEDLDLESLTKIVKPVSVRLKKPDLVIFSTCDPSNQSLIGIAVGRDPESLFNILNRKPIVKASITNGTIVLTLKAADINEYRNAVNLATRS